jgi:hypothetical protein
VPGRGDRLGHLVVGHHGKAVQIDGHGGAAGRPVKGSPVVVDRAHVGLRGTSEERREPRRRQRFGRAFSTPGPDSACAQRAGQEWRRDVHPQSQDPPQVFRVGSDACSPRSRGARLRASGVTLSPPLQAFFLATNGPLSLVTYGSCRYPGIPTSRQRSPEIGRKYSGFACGRRKNRTFNKRIKSPLLCQLSYAPDSEFLSVVRPSSARARGESNT